MLILILMRIFVIGLAKKNFLEILRPLLLSVANVQIFAVLGTIKVIENIEFLTLMT
jgi:hypothetical protein